MSKLNPWKISTFIMAGAFVMALGGGFVGAAPVDREDRQPHMAAALQLLQNAHGQLEKATADKGGHRVKAMALTKSAIEEVKAGIAFDNAH